METRGEVSENNDAVKNDQDCENFNGREGAGCRYIIKICNLHIYQEVIKRMDGEMFFFLISNVNNYSTKFEQGKDLKCD